MRPRSMIVLSLSALVGLSLPLASEAKAQPMGVAHPAGAKESIITATGTARVERTPDYVDVSFGIAANESTAAAAQESASRTMEKALQAVKGLQLAGFEPQTGTVQLSPRYEERPPSSESPKIIGYVGTILLRVRTTDTNSVAKVIDAALVAGCNRVDSVEFGIKEALEAREEAIRLATKAAQRKAKVMADALGLHLARVVDASTGSHQMGWTPTYANRAQVVNEASASGGGDEQSPIVPGKVEVWVDATITYTAAPEGDK